MGRTGATLPVALAVLGGCMLPRVLALRAELGAERTATRVRADSAGSLEMLERPEQVTSSSSPAFLQTVQWSTAGDGSSSDSSTEDAKRSLEEKIAAITAQEAERKRHSKDDAEADWTAEAAREDSEELAARARQAGKARLEEAKRRSQELFDRWQAEKQEKVRIWRAERKRDVAAKKEAEKQEKVRIWRAERKMDVERKAMEEAERKATEEAEHAPTAVSSPNGTLKDTRKTLEDAIAALPQIPDVEPARKAMQRELDEIVKKQLQETLLALPQISDVQPARLEMQAQLNEVSRRIRRSV